MVIFPRILSIMFFCVFFTGVYSVTNKTKASKILVFAASSLTSPLQEIARRHYYSSKNKVRFSFASSSTLARQIREGAPAHLFISANHDWIDFLIKEDLVTQICSSNLLSNKLALVTMSNNIIAVNNLQESINKIIASGERLAIGDPTHVPLGKYSKEALMSLGLWLKLENKISRLSNARSVVAFVERNEVIAGIVYKSDTYLNKKIKIINNFPINSHEKIKYFIAVTKSTKEKDAQNFCRVLSTNKAKNIFKNYGFLVE